MSTTKWRDLAQEKRDYIWVYGWGAITFVVFLFFTPDTVSNFIGRIAVFAVTCAAVSGGVLAAVGVYLGDNLVLERSAVRVLIWAPILYSLIQAATGVYELMTLGYTQRWYIVFIGLWPVLFLRKRQHQLSARVKLAKETPLPGEESE